MKKNVVLILDMGVYNQVGKRHKKAVMKVPSENLYFVCYFLKNAKQKKQLYLIFGENK